MKKKYLSFIICCLMGVQLYAATTPGKPTGNERIFLHHQGKVNLYDADKLAEAVKASVDGDTIFLSNGNYGFLPTSDGKEVYYGAQPITINKSVCIVGEGESTYIGALAINMDDSQGECHLYGIKSSLSITHAMQKLDIQKCHVKLSINATINETQLLQSKLDVSINGWNTQLNTFNANNSLITSFKFLVVDTDNLHIHLKNCNIRELTGSGDDGDEYMNSFKGDITNSIIDHVAQVAGAVRYFDPAVTLTNVLVRKTTDDYDPFKICKQTNSIALLSTDEIVSEAGVCRWNKEELESLGYLGDDNTVMGIYGGPTPYAPMADTPLLSNPQFDINTSNHKLMFNLDVK